MNCRQFKPVVMSTGSCSRSGDSALHSPRVLQVHIDFIHVPWKAMRNHIKTTNWRRQIWGKRWKSCSLFLPHSCVCVLYQSFHKNSSCLTFSCYTHWFCSCIQICYKNHMLWNLFTPSDTKLSSTCCGVIEFWKQKCFPASLQECWKFLVFPSAYACFR